MTDYTELVKALRVRSRNLCPGDICDICEEIHFLCSDKVMHDAAAAIEDLQAQLPKHGKWIKHPEVKNIYGGVYIECPFCGEKYVVQDVSDEKFCRNCGSNLRAKMEVQDA